VELGASLDCRDSTGRTPLHWASYHGEEGAARVLLEAGAASSLQNIGGYTALHLAVWRNRPGVVRILLKHNCPWNTVGPLL
jgi:ankyrin repeat protein